MAAKISSNSSDIISTCWRICWQQPFFLICLWHASDLAVLLSLNFLFTWDYYISTRDEIFHIIAFFFNSIYQAEISTQDENLHIISSFRGQKFLFFHLQLIAEFSEFNLNWKAPKKMTTTKIVQKNSHMRVSVAKG